MADAYACKDVIGISGRCVVGDGLDTCRVLLGLEIDAYSDDVSRCHKRSFSVVPDVPLSLEDKLVLVKEALLAVRFLRRRPS